MNELSQPVQPQPPPAPPETHPPAAASTAPHAPGTASAPTAPAHGPEPAAQPAERRLGRRRRRRRHRRRPESDAAPIAPRSPAAEPPAAAGRAPRVESRSAHATLPVWSGTPVASEPLPAIPHALPAAARPRGEPALGADPSLRADVSEDGKIRYRMVTRQKLGWKYLLSEVFD